MRKTALALAALVACVPALGAQVVGTLPDQSPYADIQDGQRLTAVVGWLQTGHDAVGVNAKSAPMFGARYDLSIGGAAYVTGLLFGAAVNRTVLDYTKAPANRNIGTQSFALIDASAQLALSLTGKRTWHRLQPLINIGAGIASGVGDNFDVSEFTFGTSFQFSYGAGLRFIASRNSEFRLDVDQYWWELKYPPLYRSTQGSPTAIKPTGSLSSWTANTALTLGWTFYMFR